MNGGIKVQDNDANKSSEEKTGELKKKYISKRYTKNLISIYKNLFDIHQPINLYIQKVLLYNQKYTTNNLRQHIT